MPRSWRPPPGGLHRDPEAEHGDVAGDDDSHPVLIVGSSSTHQLDRVFLGFSAAKIVRHATVPVIAVPDQR